MLQVPVPDVTGLSLDEASARIVKSRLLAEQSGTLASRRAEGTVVKQSPGSGTAVPVGSKVQIWVSQGVEPPALKAVIIPERLELTQGEEAAFVSGSSSPVRRVREEWSGPDNHSGSGKRFVVSTEGLSPGTYPIRLLMTDTTERSSRAVATLVVRARPEVRYHLKARVVPEAISAGEAVRASAAPERAVAGVEYGFDFGDGTAFTQSRTAEAMHTYAAPGEFSVIVFARIREKIIAQSDRIKVTVKRKVPRSLCLAVLRLSMEQRKEGGEMSDNAVTLADLFVRDVVDLKVRMPASGAISSIAALKSRLEQEGSKVTFQAALDAIEKGAHSLLNIRIEDILLPTWKKYLSLRKYLDKEKYPPEKVSLVPIAEHTVRSEHHPYIEFRINDQPAGKIAFCITVSLMAKGMILVIRDGRIWEIRTGECSARGSITCEGIPNAEKSSEIVPLPGAISFAEGVPVG